MAPRPCHQQEQTTTKAAEWNLRYNSDDLAVDDPHLQADASAFRAWCKFITTDSLMNTTWGQNVPDGYDKGS